MCRASAKCDFWIAYDAVNYKFKSVFVINIPLAVARFWPKIHGIAWIATNAKGDKMIFFVMFGVHVGAAILPHMSLFDFVGVVSRWKHGLGVALHADRGMNILLRDVWVNCSRSECGVWEVIGKGGECQSDCEDDSCNNP